LEDVRRTTHIMQIRRGAPTHDLNPVRNHLDQMKGGRLSRHIQPARAVHIVAYNPYPYEYLMTHNVWLHSLPEGSTYADALAMLHKWGAWEAVPESVRRHLLRADPALETVKREEFERAGSPIYGVMPRRLGMLPTAQREAEALGFKTLLLTHWLQAEASQAALVLADIALSVEKHGLPIEPPCALINGGELLVTVGEENGMGGRNQEWACSAALRIAGSPHIVMGSVDSDGTDGPGHQFRDDGQDIPVLAGGIVDGHTLERAQALGVDLWEALRRHHTSPALYRLDDGVIASYSISLTDLTVTLITGRGINPNWPR
ncbi:MAG: DUF4147 domain-containing protein, partial [Anaerolineae bacterium]|nr:DUF4147 domain-containing protein [Anaerolineae bacterium]